MEETKEILRISNTPTVKACPEGFYEVMVKHPMSSTNIPHVRIPINEVIMFIEM